MLNHPWQWMLATQDGFLGMLVSDDAAFRLSCCETLKEKLR